MRIPRLLVGVAASTLAVAALMYLQRGVLAQSWETATTTALVTYSLLIAGAYAWHQRARESRVAVTGMLPDAVPLTLHPVIDHQRCIGSLSCLQVCPEGDILGVVNGKAALVNPIGCIGHGKCEAECPVDAIKLVFGSSKRGVDLPQVNEHFECARPGIHIIGELGGMGLIRNAMVQGVQLAEHLGQQKRAPASQGLVDVAIVGAGPAGIAAALGLKEQGLSLRVLDQQALGGAIFNYPRQKVVVSDPIKLPGHGWFGKGVRTKEALLEEMGRMVQKGGISIESGTKVTGVEGQDGDFRVQTSRGEVRARKVVLAIGRRGTPRKLGCPGEDLPKVTYMLTDPQQYDGAKVLVVGGGDSALEAAIQLIEQSDAEVTLSYRGAEFGRARAANKAKVQEHADAGRLQLLLGSNVKQVLSDEVELDVGGKSRTLQNDFVLACLGGELPTDFLHGLKISLRRHYGSELGEQTDPGFDGRGKAAKAQRGSAKRLEERARQAKLAVTLFAVGVVMVACFGVAGWDYYRLSAEDRLGSPFHAMLRPAGPWGHGIGIVSTAFMMSNFIYALRKRWRLLKGRGHIHTWLTWHQFVGFMSPVMICFHAAFQSNNLLATYTAAGMSVVVLTGLVGRYVYGFVSDDTGQVREFAETAARWNRYKHRLESLGRNVQGKEAKVLATGLWEGPMSGSLPAMLARFPWDLTHAFLQLRRTRRLFPEKDQYLAFRSAGLRMLKLRIQATFHVRLKRFLRVWRIWHVSLALVLVVLITAHISVSVYLGFTWLF